MPKFSEETLTSFTFPPSESEETKLANSERMVKEAIYNSVALKNFDIKVFGQGSYANDTNVRLNSDIDINSKLTDTFYYGLPAGKTASEFGLNSPSSYTFHTYKNAVEQALKEKFGDAAVVRNDKCLTVLGNTYRVETDVVPTFSYRRYNLNGSYVEGVKFLSDSGKEVINYPLQHIENGKLKNAKTAKRFKRLTRIFRRIRYKMIDDRVNVSDNITSFLLECLVWNVPDSIFNNNYTWTDRLKSAIVHIHLETSEYDKCKEWGEVSELLYLFRGNRKWSYSDVNNYMIQMWNYLEY